MEGGHEWQRPHELVEAVAPEIERAHRAHELALATSGRAIVVEAEAAGALARGDGVAAILPW